VQVGNPVSDTAGLSGTATRPGSPIINGPVGAAAAGSITFNLYGPNDASCGLAPVFTSAAVPVAGNGQYSSGNYTPTAAGTYRWVASYTGDSPNTLSINGVCNGTNESVVVTPKQPTITTDATADPPTGLPLGSAISDQATLAGTATGAGGSIIFRLYGPDDASCTVAKLVFTSAAVPVSGDGTYSSGNYTPAAAGTYRWIASYSGDLPNTLAVAGVCGDTNEASLLISLQPTIATAQTFTVKDSATITVGTGAGNLAGNVRFRLYNNATCTPGAGNVNILFDSGSIAVAGASPQTRETGVLTITTSKPVLSWLVEYTTTNTGHKDVTSACNTENASLSISNGS
jgi:hypothetical protein